MAQGKFTEKVINLRCATCKRSNYTTRKNKKVVERKIEFKKYCPWCREHTAHKESKK
ncbi:MAG: 50S ribosomal protein L33 [bacterium]|nr:50S ribosomal protein L33 [bacterium]